MSATPPPLPAHQPQPVLAYASPVTQPAGTAAWRRGSLLLTSRSVQLPPFCTKCNQPEAKRFRKDVYWHEPWLYATILAGVLVYAILALVLRKKATYDCGLCEKHARQRSNRVATAWMLVLAGLIGVVSGIMGANRVFGRELEDVLVWFIPLGFLVLIAAGIYAAIVLPLLKPKKVDEHYAHYAGCGDAFLRNFAEA